MSISQRKDLYNFISVNILFISSNNKPPNYGFSFNVINPEMCLSAAWKTHCLMRLTHYDILLEIMQIVSSFAAPLNWVSAVKEVSENIRPSKTSVFSTFVHFVIPLM